MGAAKNRPKSTIAGAKPVYCDAADTPRRRLSFRVVAAGTAVVEPLEMGVVEELIRRPSVVSAQGAPASAWAARASLRAEHRVECGDVRVGVLLRALQVR